MTQALFVVDASAANAANLVVSEINYEPLGPTAAEAGAGFSSGNQFEFIELLNVSEKNVDLNGVIISEAVDFNFASANPNTLTVPPGGRVVVVGNQSAFLFRYGNNPLVKIAGVFAGNLSNAGEQLTIRAADNSLISQFTWGTAEPWPVAANGPGYTLVFNKPAANPTYTDGANWRSSATTGGKPGVSDSTPFTGSPDGDTDHDGHSDFLEYATGSNASDSASLYKPSIDMASYTVGAVAANYLRFQYRRNLNADGCNYSVLLSDDAVTWQSGPTAVTYVGSANNGDGTATVTCRSTQPIDASHPRLFMRLKVNP